MRRNQRICYRLSMPHEFGPAYWASTIEHGIEGSYSGFFPAVDCLTCEQDFWEPTLSFSVIDVYSLPHPMQLRRRRHVRPKRFRELAAEVSACLTTPRMFLPGCNLGPFVGHYQELNRAIEWFGVLDVFFRKDLLDEISRAGVQLETATVTLTGPKGPVNSYAIVQAEVLQVFHPRQLPKWGLKICPDCGNLVREDPNSLPHGGRVWYLLDASKRSSVPPVFTPLYCAGPLLLSDALADLLRRLAPSGLQMEEIGEWI